MNVAVTYENGQVFQHFGHTQNFKVYQVENNAVVTSQVVDTNGQGHGALASFLANHQIQVLICGGIGGGARQALQEAGITLLAGVSGSADQAVQDYLAGTLHYDPNAQCADHHGHHHGGDHGCGEHGCGHHGCHSEK